MPGRGEDVVLDAVGPETFTFEEMVRLIARRVGSRARLIHVRPSVALLAARMAGLLVRDVVLTRDEIDGLMAGHLVSADPPTASTRFTEWLEAEGATLGRRYASELGRLNDVNHSCRLCDNHFCRSDSLSVRRFWAALVL